MAHYLFNLVGAEGEGQAARRIRAKMWGVDAGERHRDALAPGDLVLIYLGAPKWEFVGRAELASAAHDWTPPEREAYPGDSPGGVLLADVEEWDPPVPINAVLEQIDPSEGARADFETGVLLVTPHEYDTTLAVAAGRGPSTG